MKKKIIESYYTDAVNEKATSKAQQKAAGIALSVKRGDTPKSKLKGAAKSMIGMSEKDLEDFAKTKHKGLPMKKESIDEATQSEWEITYAANNIGGKKISKGKKVKVKARNSEEAHKKAAVKLGFDKNAPLDTIGKIKKLDENMALRMRVQKQLNDKYVNNPKTKKDVKVTTALADKKHPSHKKAKGIFSRLMDKLKSKNETYSTEDAMNESNENINPYQIDNKSINNVRDILKYMYGDNFKNGGKWKMTNSVNGKPIVNQKDIGLLVKKYGKGNVVVKGKTRGGDPAVEVFTEGVILEATKSAVKKALMAVEAANKNIKDHLALYLKAKGKNDATEMAKHAEHLKKFHSDKKKLESALESAITGLDKDVQLAKTDESIKSKVRTKIIEALKSIVNEKDEAVFIEFLNKDKNFKKDTKHFKSYDEAVKWAKANFDKFSPDMIKYESLEINEKKFNTDDVKKGSYVTYTPITGKTKLSGVVQGTMIGPNGEQYLKIQGKPVPRANVISMRAEGMNEAGASDIMKTAKGLDKWWEFKKADLMSYIYWTKRQLPPSDEKAYDKQWVSVVQQLHKKYPAPGSILKKKLKEEFVKALAMHHDSMDEGIYVDPSKVKWSKAPISYRSSNNFKDAKEWLFKTYKLKKNNFTMQKNGTEGSWTYYIKHQPIAKLTPFGKLFISDTLKVGKGD